MGKEWGLILIDALEGGNASRGGGEGVMSIFCPNNLFTSGSSIVDCQTVRGSFQVLVLSLHFSFELGMTTRRQAD